jgi:hypothetical protein
MALSIPAVRMPSPETVRAIQVAGLAMQLQNLQDRESLFRFCGLRYSQALFFNMFAVAPNFAARKKLLHIMITVNPADKGHHR